MSSISCVLNDVYKENLQKKNLIWAKSKIKIPDYFHKISTSYIRQGLKTKTMRNLLFQSGDLCAHQLGCCGIHELYFEFMQRRKKVEYETFFEELVAKYIDIAVGHRDQRVVIVGIPTEVAPNSQYRLSFYEKLKDTLLKFGFIEVVKTPYKNINSGNKITVLTGQIPMLENFPNIFESETLDTWLDNV